MNSKNNKLLLIGWDAADWKIIGPLLAKGQMPSLKKIIDKGVYGNMSTMNPPYSPMLWTSVATGKTPDKHGVLGFIEVLPNLEGVRQVTTNSRKCRTIWNILHHHNLKSNIVGWWPSFPVEPINGVIISDKFQKVSSDPKKQSPIPKSVIHPEELTKEFKDLRMFPFEITEEHILPFIPKANLINQDENNLLSAFAKIMSQNVSVHNAATKLLRTTEWDFMAIYYDLIDHFCHSYMKYFAPKRPQVPEDLFDIYKDAVNGAYRFQDMMLGRTLELIDDDTTVIIMSDHGYESGSRRILEMPKVQAAPALEHRQFGIFVASGPNIKKNEKIFGLGLTDITPTILHHYNLPIGKDMDGKVALDIFKKTKKPKFIPSWETIKGDFGELDKTEFEDNLSDQETIEQLIELGYIERPDEKKEIAVLKTKCDLKHNLAKVYLGKKNYIKSKELLLELIEEEDPIDTAPYYMDLITICLRERDYQKAEGFLNIVKNSKTKVNYNLSFTESDILFGLGKYDDALKVLEERKKININSELWFKMGKIHFISENFEDAKLHFQKAIDIEPDNAKYQRGIAEAYFKLNRFEDSVDHALTSIELIKYFPGAHYILGKSLEKLGDLENAKMAFQNAEKLNKKTYHKAKQSLENLNKKIDNVSKTYKYYDNQIVIVSGLPRSGTSLMMQMIHNGGINALTDNTRQADNSNPKGYFEYEPVMSIFKDNSWLKLAQNKSVKIVAPLLKYLLPNYRYKIIFMNRDIHEIVKSQQKMIGKDTKTLPINLINGFKTQLISTDKWQKNEPGVDLIYINYKDALNNTKKVLDKIESFIGIDLNKNEMAKCIDKKLYRTKV